MANDNQMTQEPSVLNGLIASGNSSMTRTQQAQVSPSGIRQRLAKALRALVVVFLPTVSTLPSTQAQTYTVLHTFTGTPNGTYPARLIRDAAGNLYGTTGGGGDYGLGTVFKLNAAGNYEVLYSFTGEADGAGPAAGVIRDAAGNLYGTTVDGGDISCDPPGRCGTVFKLDAAGKETVLYRFKGGLDGSYPHAGLIRDAAGNLYGTTSFGGAFDEGTVFKLDTAGEETVLHTFTGVSGDDGDLPGAGLIGDATGNLYGTTEYGGNLGFGTVFKLNRGGKYKVLYRFKGSFFGPDGAVPFGGLIRDAAGNLYGTTHFGGASGAGTVFKLGAAGKETLLYSFTGGADGSNPFGGLIRDAAGNLHGTTYFGGAFGAGTVFKLGAAGKETVLYTFTGGADGANPYAGLIRDAAGNLYGTTYSGGDLTCHRPYGCGVVFKIELP